MTAEENLKKWDIIQGPNRKFALQDFGHANNEKKKLVVSVVEKKAYVFKNKTTNEFYTYDALKCVERDNCEEMEIAKLKQNHSVDFNEFAYEELTSEAFVEIVKAIRTLN